MLLDDLVTAIQTVQQRIREHGTTLSQNEYRTRLALIDPILNALGWDVSDPALVTIEDYHSGSGTPDYALLGQGKAKPIAFIEAKKLNEPLDAHQDQVFKYTWDRKVFYAGLTNGDRWIVRDVTAEFSKPPRDGLLLDLTISQGTIEKLALQFLLLWHPTLASGEPTKANEPVFEEGEVYPPPPPPPPLGWVSLAEYKVTGGTKPPNIRLPDKGDIPLKHWYKILVETAEWLVRTGDLTTASCPVMNSLGGGLVNTEPQEQSGQPFRSHRKLENGLFVKIHGSARSILGSTKILLKHFGKDPTAILLKPSQ